MISKTVFLKKSFRTQNAKNPQCLSGVAETVLRNTEPRKGTETVPAHAWWVRLEWIEKHRTPKGDGNTYVILYFVSCISIEKHRTPKGDGN